MMDAYKFEWDKRKAESNFRKHNVTFEQAKTVFNDENALIFYDDFHSDDEDRFIIIGKDLQRLELRVCHCYRDGDSIIRIITARTANKSEIEMYRRQSL